MDNFFNCHIFRSHMSTYVVLLTKRGFLLARVVLTEVLTSRRALKTNPDALGYLNMVLKYVHVLIFNHFWSKW